jgi:KUP system potassium uptake protein
MPLLRRTSPGDLRHPDAPSRRRPHAMKGLTLAALGVVYGDIGTSPLYTFKECFFGSHGIPGTPENVLGIVSLILWSLVVVVTLKYLTLFMIANNEGEGGIMALLALVAPRSAERGARSPLQRGTWLNTLTLTGLFGAALLYGDGMITPAISVLGAVEGLSLASPALQHLVVPITLAILLGLFLAQKHGTTRIAKVFAPIMLTWFAVIAAMGVPWILEAPRILLAADPRWALDFFLRNGWTAFLSLSAVVLCITGCEALYADMGHFGARPIRRAWYFIVFPALLLNYFGQGAYLLSHGPEGVTNPFFELAPSFLLWPLIVVATVAAVIASQALISGAYSLTLQAIRLGYLPRLPVIHTSEHMEGQIYMPHVNFALMVGCLLLVLTFGSATNLAAAYGIAVMGTMLINSILFHRVIRERWHWSALVAGAIAAFFLVIDAAFLSANAAKFFHGGWAPVAIAVVIYAAMATWRRGRGLLSNLVFQLAMPISEFLELIRKNPVPRVPGIAIFMTPNAGVAPRVLLHHFKHNQVLHEKVLLLTINTLHVPSVAFHEHGRVTDLGDGLYQLISNYGYMQPPRLSEILQCCGPIGLAADQADVSFYLGRETLLTDGPGPMARWRKMLFAFLSRNSQPATAFFEIPPDQVIELGMQLRL